MMISTHIIHSIHRIRHTVAIFCELPQSALNYITWHNNHMARINLILGPSSNHWILNNPASSTTQTETHLRNPPNWCQKQLHAEYPSIDFPVFCLCHYAFGLQVVETGNACHRKEQQRHWYTQNLSRVRDLEPQRPSKSSIRWILKSPPSWVWKRTYSSYAPINIGPASKSRRNLQEKAQSRQPSCNGAKTASKLPAKLKGLK